MASKNRIAVTLQNVRDYEEFVEIDDKGNETPVDIAEVDEDGYANIIYAGGGWRNGTLHRIFAIPSE